MLERFLQFIKKHALFSSEDKLLVAVSGGVDSVVLCHLLTKGGFNFSIAHCNFKLRAQSSDLDEVFVQELAEELSVPCFSKSFDTRDHAEKYGISAQMAARELRYGWFDELKNEHGFNCLLTAHHKNDIAETILLNLTRGTSINGVAGIPLFQNGKVRPLLSFAKSELLGYALNRKVKWREDASNKSVNYKRNKIRHEVVPLLEEINPSFLKQAERFAEKNKVVKDIFQKHIQSLKAKLLFQDEGIIKMRKSTLDEMNISAFEMEELLIPFGFNYDQAHAILEVKDGLAGTKFVSPSHALFIDREYIIIDSVDHDRSHLSIERTTRSFDLHRKYSLSYHDIQQIELDKNPAHAMLDTAKLEFPLIVRPWKKGDKFRPLGMKGMKLISDFLIDEKVSSAEKSRVYLLQSGTEVVWVIGYRISEDFKRSATTKEVLHIQCSTTDKSHL